MRLATIYAVGTLLCAILSNAGRAQEPANIRTLDDSRSTFSTSHDTDRDGETTRLERWMWRIEPRVVANGKFPQRDVLLRELNKYQSTHSADNGLTSQVSNGSWTPVGPFGFDQPIENNGGSGRVNVIRFHPFDSNTIFIGTPDGGLWKSTNAGANWSPITDQIPCLGISDIAIDPKNPNTIYIATGDAKAPGMYGNPYSYGVLKSNNGGRDWLATGLVLDPHALVSVPRIVISPSNSSVILAGVYGGDSRGIQRSTDGGATWSIRDGGSIYDIQYNPSNPSIVYASGYGNFRRSTNGGDTWTSIKSILPTWPDSNVTRTAIGVTPADPNVVYVLYVDRETNSMFGLYRSTDRGLSFEKMSDSTELLGEYGDYNLVLAVSPIDPHTIIIGQQMLAKSSDDGRTWTSLDEGGYSIHVDNHALAFSPKGGLIYSGNDGGIVRSDDNGDSWTDLSTDLQITQFYRISTASKCSETIFGGAQDNGILGFDKGTWWHPHSQADGGKCLVDYSNASIVYMEWQSGWLMRSNDGGHTDKKIAPSGAYGAWIMPYALSPRDPNTIVAAYQNVYRSTDRGENWGEISGQMAFGDNFKSLAIAPSDDRVIYTGTYVRLYKTTDGGTQWTDITNGTPCSDTCALTYIAVSPKDPNHFWLTFSGFTDHQHVYESTDGGKTYTNLTGSLPNVPVNTIVCSASNEALYIGTDIGVFYRDSSTNEWRDFSAGLPRVSVSELELHEGSGALRAATFGRGVWQTPIKDLAAPEASIAIRPGADTLKQATTPRFVWHELARRRNFFVQVAKDSAFSQIVLAQDSIFDTSYQFATKLETGSQYFWRVRASNLAGDGGWSMVHSFKTLGTNEVAIALDVQISIYPNPVAKSQLLRVAGIQTPCVANLYDAAGRLISRSRISEDLPMSLEGVTAGLYQLIIEMSDGTRHMQNICIVDR